MFKKNNPVCLTKALFIGLAMLVMLVVPRLNVAAASNAEPIKSADETALDKLTAAQIAAMDTKEVAPFYAARMSSPGPGNAWIPIIDADMVVRPEAGKILSELLRHPAHDRIRSNVWGWLSEHPSFPVTPSLFEQSLELYRLEHQNWRWRNRAGFADFISVFGTSNEAPIIEELARGHGPGVDFAKARFDKRMNALASPGGSGASNGAQLKPQPPTTPALETKPITQGAEPSTAASWFGWLLPLAVMVAIGLLWAVFKKRR